MAEEKKELPLGKQLSIEQEERLAKMFGGYRTPRSGGGNWTKGDVSTGRDGLWFVEAKTMTKPSASYSVRKDVLDKMDHERAEMHKPYAALAFTFGNHEDDYFVVNKRTMKAILEQQSAIKELYDTISKELTDIEARREEMKNSGTIVSPMDDSLYTAHKAEKMAMLRSLEEIL